MSKFVPSIYQQRLFDFVEHGRGSAIVKAVAGSGKTTSILKSLEKIPERASVQLFAFNSTIAVELRERVKAMAEASSDRNYAGVRASTFHSIGFAAVCKKLGKRANEVKIDGKKMLRLAQSVLSPSAYEMYGEFCAKLVGLAKGEGAGAIVAFNPDRWQALISHHDLFLDDEDATEEEAIEIARDLLRRSNELAKSDALIDYDDQLYLPLLWRLRLLQNDFVFVDEAQDTNPVRRAIAKLALRPGGRLIAVGDPRQAIYGFTGASHDAIELIQREFNCIELPLTVSYRCPKKVVELAQDLVPYIEAHPEAPDGDVLFVPLFNPHRSNLAHPQSGHDCAMDFLCAEDAILCRNTAPLVGLAYELIAKGTACTVLGREIGSGLVVLIKQMKARSLDKLVEKLDHYKTREVAKFTAKSEEQKAEAVIDRVDCVMTVVNHLHENERTIAGLISRIEGMFSDSKGVLTLLTAHKAKGKEYDTVAILRPELMPSKWARQDWQAFQEENLMYVAWTRAKKRLIFIEEMG